MHFKKYIGFIYKHLKSYMSSNYVSKYKNFLKLFKSL